MRILTTWGSKRGGTEGIAQTISAALAEHGFEVIAVPANRARHVGDFDAVIIGGALYANRWPRDVRRFVDRNVKQLRQKPVWLFSSGPLDDSAETNEIPPVTQVSVIAQRTGAKGHVTFGGRLVSTAKGFPASAMAKTHSGDWRNFDEIRAWADKLALELPHAEAGTVVEPPARSRTRLLAHGVVGWALCAAVMGLLLRWTSVTAALVVHGIAAPVFFAAVAYSYFSARGARDALATAATWTLLTAGLDAVVVAGMILRRFDMFASVAGTWLPLLLIFLTVWAVGEVMSMMPFPKPQPQPSPRHA